MPHAKILMIVGDFVEDYEAMVPFRISAYPACAPDIESAGGTYASIAMTEAIADGALVTAPAWPAHPAWLAKFLAVLDQHLAKQAAKKEEAVV